MNLLTAVANVRSPKFPNRRTAPIAVGAHGVAPLATVLLWILIALVVRPVSAVPTSDGLYAGFLTSEGEFWCRLEFTKAPRTVGNFVSLAEGTRDWIDFGTAKIVRRPFYNGIAFHRVIDGFMIQGGSPNGLGNDGPGYQFADEFDPSLLHSKAGTLSMANSGKNSNGSQFFVTVTNTPWLDGAHSVFGEVVEGIEVVHRISLVPRDTGDHPLTPVVIQELRILRIGSAAIAFNPATVTPAPPDVGVVPIHLESTATTLNLRMQSRTNHLQHAFFGSDLLDWAVQTFRGTPTNLNATSLMGFPNLFFRVLDGGIEP
ncbi:MAG: peptidylprolyl isomerase [Limisphaerales bacterium]